jgi:hypothetical protein
MHAPAGYRAWPPPPPSAVATRWPLLAPAVHHRTSSSGADDDLSASNATMTSAFINTAGNHSGLSMDSAVAADSHLWNQVLM